jgi:hypothetical protein
VDCGVAFVLVDGRGAADALCDRCSNVGEPVVAHEFSQRLRLRLERSAEAGLVDEPVALLARSLKARSGHEELVADLHVVLDAVRRVALEDAWMFRPLSLCPCHYFPFPLRSARAFSGASAGNRQWAMRPGPVFHAPMAVVNSRSVRCLSRVRVAFRRRRSAIR